LNYLDGKQRLETFFPIFGNKKKFNFFGEVELLHLLDLRETAKEIHTSTNVN
jgi:hypothetical protein